MNRTLTLTQADFVKYSYNLLHLEARCEVGDILNTTICGNTSKIIEYLPSACADLLILDPPYNMCKVFGSNEFKKMAPAEYLEWFESWFAPLLRVLKPTATLYVCADWSTYIQPVLAKYTKIHNRITWEREKGRGALSNWKNCSEDIWFCTLSNKYTFNVDAVKLKRRVLAPYKKDGEAKDWKADSKGNFRFTCPSNLWTDITVPFWSMPENTEHPTQKPEKLIAKLILASSNPGDVILDPFLGSGTTSVVAKKLQRNYIGIEKNSWYCALAELRLDIAGSQPRIQGYEDGVFLHRNYK